MTQLVTIENNTISLNTNMTPIFFAKARFSERLREKGVVAEFNGTNWEYSPWIFDNTEERDGLLFLKGTAFDGRTVDEILNCDSENKIQKLAVTLCEVLENSLGSKAPVENIGGGGIIVSDDLTKFLFLPYNFWTSASMTAGDEIFSTLNGIYITQNLDREISLRFTQAVLIYKAITGLFPFTETETKKRIMDIHDENYTKLCWTVPGIDKKITDFTERAFARKIATYPSEQFSSYQKNELPEKDLLSFKRNSETAKKHRDRKVQSRRFVRAHRTAFISSGIALFITLVITGHLVNTSLEKPTSRSLTSIETLQMYFTALNELNVDAAKNCTEDMQSHVDNISSYFLKTRTRSMYNRQADTVTPAAWFIKNQIQHNIFGLSHFYIEGKEGSLNVEGPRKKTRPSSLLEEQGIQLKEGDSRTYKVEYILLDTTGEDEIKATISKEEATLNYRNGRWVLTSIEPSEQYEVQKFSLSELTEDYLSCMKPNSNLKEDVLEACHVLEDKYFFIPTEHEIDEGYEYLKKISVFKFD
ncbi:hypothetical protein [Treponema sp.]|uniref:hypothetical protein n=1 Tax=Treponema sp. TaxID=166 RepID=UPI00388F7D17